VFSVVVVGLRSGDVHYLDGWMNGWMDEFFGCKDHDLSNRAFFFFPQSFFYFIFLILR
jgi:hypothetical protein